MLNHYRYRDGSGFCPKSKEKEDGKLVSFFSLHSALTIELCRHPHNENI